MGKFLFWALLALFVVYWVKRLGKPGATKPKSENAPEKMVLCSICGVHMPQSEGISEGGRVSCRDVNHCVHRK